MAINFSTGFDPRTTEPIDKRLVLSKSEMLRERYHNDTIIPLPTHYLCVCTDDSQLYLYDYRNTIKSGTGRFRPVSTSIPGSEIIINNELYKHIEVDGMPVQVQSAIEDGEGNNIADFLAAKQDMLTAGNNIEIENNIISATIPSVIINEYQLDEQGIIDYAAGSTDLLTDIRNKKSILLNGLEYCYLKHDSLIDKTFYRTVDLEYRLLNDDIDPNSLTVVAKFAIIEFHVDTEEPSNTYAYVIEYEDSSH